MVCNSIRHYCSGNINFYLFTDKIIDKSKIPSGVKVKLISPEDQSSLDEVYYKEGRGDIPSFAAYAQFLLPRYFNELDHLLYLEVDQIVKGDLSSQYQKFVVENHVLSAVHFQDHKFRRAKIKSFKRQFKNQAYFNTGVLFMNVHKCLGIDFEKKCIHQAFKQISNAGMNYDYYAQGAINNAVGHYIYEIGKEYNLTGFGHLCGIPEDLIKQAIILHWTGPRKPWSKNGLYKDLYYQNREFKNSDDYIDNMSIFKKIYYDALYIAEKFL